MIRSLIFDFDGLILETEGPIFQSWQEMYRSFGIELTLAQWASVIGTSEMTFDPMSWLETQLGYPLDRQSLLPLRRQREIDLIQSQPPLPGVTNYLADAKELGLGMAVASSSSRSWVIGHLSRLSLLDYFQHIITSDDVQRTKPDPQLFLTALAALRVKPEEAIVFEDSPNGILAAKRAGLLCVAVPNDLTRQLPLELADLRLESLANLPLQALIKQISRNGITA